MSERQDMRTDSMSATPARLALAVSLLMIGAFLALAGFGDAANAQVDPYSTGSPTVLPTRITNTASPSESPDSSPTVLPTTLGRGPRHPGPDSNPPEILPSSEEGGLLPLTGADLTLFAATGASAIGTGVLFVRRSRRRR